MFNHKLFEKIIFGLFFIWLVAFIFFSFQNSQNYIFQEADDYLCPAAVKDFLTTGSYHWAGARPGLIILASLFGLNTPYKISFMFVIFALLAVAGLFLLSRSVFKNLYLSFIPAVLWMTSEMFFYNSKTHLLIFVTFYFWGIWLCYEGLENSKWWKYYLGCFLLGYSILTHYLIIFYLPIIFLFFLFLFWQKRYTLFSFIVKTFIPFLLPVFLIDSFAVGTYFLLGKKNWPFLYSVIGQHKVLMGCASNVDFFKIICVPHFIYRFEFLPLTILIGISFIFFIFYIVKNFYLRKMKNSDLLLLVLFLPTISVSLRFCLGYLTALRAFGATLPIVYVFVSFLFFKIFSRKYWSVLFLLTLILCFWRLYLNATNYSVKYITEWSEIAGNFEKSNFDVVIYLGTHNSLEQIINSKQIVSLNVESDALLLLREGKRKEEFFALLTSKLNQGKKLALVLWGDSKILNFVTNEFYKFFKVEELSKKKPFRYNSIDIIDEGSIDWSTSPVIDYYVATYSLSKK